jgi:hypothetical protein
METTMEKVNTMKMTSYNYRELAGLMQGLIGVQELKGVKFSLQVTKNINLIKAELEHLEEAAKPSDEFNALAIQVREIEADQDLEQDDKMTKIKEIEDKNPELIDTRKAQIDEFNKMLDDTTEISLFKLSENHLPADITPKQLASIGLIIKE